jgi:hypothetical protein
MHTWHCPLWSLCPFALTPTWGTMLTPTRGLYYQNIATIHHSSYLTAGEADPRWARDSWYFFQPGHQVVCQRHNLDMNDFGFASAFKRIGHVSQRIVFSIMTLQIPDSGL